MLHSESLFVAFPQLTHDDFGPKPEKLGAAETDSWLVLIRQVDIPKSDVSESGEVKAELDIFKYEKASLQAQKKASVWEVLPALKAAEVMTSHILYYNLVLMEDWFHYELCRHFPPNKW